MQPVGNICVLIILILLISHIHGQDVGVIFKTYRTDPKAPNEKIETITTIKTGTANFGIDLKESGKIRSQVVQASPLRACGDQLNNIAEITGKIVIVERGDCQFIEKAHLIESFGAKGGILLDNSSGTSKTNSHKYVMKSSNDYDINIPMVFLYSADAQSLLQTLKENPGLEVVLSRLTSLSSIQISDIMPTSVRIKWNSKMNPGDIYNYVIKYKPRNANQNYTEISVIDKMFYTVRGLTSSTDYIFHILAVDEYDRWPPSEAAYVSTSETDCGGEFNTSSGTIRHPFRGGNYQNNENCTWIIRAAIGTVNITIVSFDTESKYDKLYVRDGESIESNVLHEFSGRNVLRSVHTSTNAANLLFASDGRGTKTGFELHWEPADAPIQTYNIPMHGDSEVRLNFSVNPEPTALKWSYGPNFQEIPNVIQIPSDNGKFSTSLIDLENGKYQALLRIAGITDEDIKTKFMLNVANNIGESNYRIMLYGCGGIFNSSSGIIRHPLSGGKYQNNESCSWIIKSEDRINFKFVSFDTEAQHAYLYIREGESIESNVLHNFTGDNIPRSFQTSTNAAHLLFTSDDIGNGTGFELHWEPVVETFYQVLLHSDYEVTLNFSINPQPTALMWSYGENFQEMPNIIHIPSDNGKFSTSLNDLGNDNYQAILRIVGITEEDIETKFKLHVENEIRERVILSAFPHSPSVENSDIKVTSVHIAWNYNNPGNILYYVIQYKPKNVNQDYTEISDIVSMFYTVIGLKGSTEYEFHVLAVNKFGRGPPSEPSFVTTRCGGEYTSSIGTIHHPLSGGNYQMDEECTWIIRPTDHNINITFIRFDTEKCCDYLTIRDGDSIESNVLGKFSGENVTLSVHTNTNAAHLLFTSDQYSSGTGFELHWVPTVKTFYEIPIHTDYDVRMNFSTNSEPTTLEWYYGGNFQEMPNLIQIPSDDGKFSTSLIDLENDKYQALLRITGITEEDYVTKFNLHVANEIGEIDYRVKLSACPGPLSLQISNITTTSVWTTWNYNTNSGNILYYVIQYKPKNSDQDYSEITGIVTNSYTVIGLTGSTEYEFYVLAVNKIGRGQPSEPSYVTTLCGGEYSSSRGTIRHPLSGDSYQRNEFCTWIIRAADHNINITFDSFDIEENYDFLDIRDGETIDSNVLCSFSGVYIPGSVQTNTNTAHLLFTSDDWSTSNTGFELHWEPAVKTFYQIAMQSDYEVRFNFSANPEPTALKWSYGANFLEMPNLIQIPSDNGKFSTSLIDLENGKYQALLKIAGITEEDCESKFKLHVANEIAETDYRVMLSAFPRPPSCLQISNITATSVHITWDYNANQGDFSYYVIQYKSNNTDQNYVELSGIATNYYTVIGLMELTKYQFHVLAVNNIGRGSPSDPSYVTTPTSGCGGDYNSTSGKLRHPLSGDNYKDDEECIWIITGVNHPIRITFISFHTETWDRLTIRDGESSESRELDTFYGNKVPKTVQTTSTSAHLFFKSDSSGTRTGFELQWEPAVAPIQTFYQIPMNSDYEVRLAFSLKPRPTALEWSYGPNFQEMSNIIQIPSYNRKYSTSIIYLKNGNYEALLRIAGITKGDIDTKFKLNVANKIIKADYKVALSELPYPPSSLQFSDIMSTSVRITCNYNVNPGDAYYYVIRYKPKNTNQNYTEISDLVTKFYTVRGLTPSTEYEFHVLTVNKIGRGPPSEPSYVTTTSCGGEFNSSSGTVHHSLNDHSDDDLKCTWIIRATDNTINITIVSFDIKESYNQLTIRDGESIESKLLGKFSGNYAPKSVQTSTNAAHLFFTSKWTEDRTGFELHWEPSVAFIQTFYQITMHSDYEVRFNFTANPHPTALDWSYGPNFQDMPNLIQIPSDNGKFSASLIDLENGNYQALLKIAGITKEDIETNFKLQVKNEIGETDYRVTLSAFPHPPSLHINDIMPTLMRITWTYNVNPEDVSYYVIQYKPRNVNQNYTEISGVVTKFYTVRDLTPSTEYEFHVLAVNKFGHGPPSEPSYVTTTSCGGEYNFNSGTLRHPMSGGHYQNHENCAWIIRVAVGTINITFISFDIHSSANLYVRDGESIESNVLKKISSWDNPKPLQTTSNVAHLLFTPDPSARDTKPGFELQWEYADAGIQTYHIPMHSNYEVRLNFSATPQPTALEWSYGPNFQEMPNLMQIPSNNGKFSTSLIDLENGNYQALLKIDGITEEDIETTFNLHVANEIGDTDYRVMLYGCGGEYNSSSGKIRHPLSGSYYKDNENCTWIIRAEDRINITFISFDINSGWNDLTNDYLHIRDGENIESNKLGRFTGSVIPWPVQTSTNVAHLLFTSDHRSYSTTGKGFELHWEPAAPLCQPKVPACSGLFAAVGDSCLLLEMTEKLTWAAARKYCQALGADLVVIKDANHYADILLYIWRVNGDNTALDLWIGGSDEAVEGNWVWITGEHMPQGPPFWGSLDRFVPEPSGGNIENCAGLYHHDRYYMHDFACTLKHAPLCQKIPISPTCF